jgi:ankyrin repeat protein
MRWGGSTALHGAVTASSQHSIILFLLEKGAKIDARNKLGWTPLMMAEGMVCGSLQKTWPETAELMRKLMRERNLDPDQYSQRAAAAQTAVRRPNSKGAGARRAARSPRGHRFEMFGVIIHSSSEAG